MQKINIFFITIFVSSTRGFDLRNFRAGGRPQHFGITDAEDQFRNLDCRHVDECEESKAEEKEIRCATDGKDYTGKCKLIKETCKDKFLSYQHLGECTAREKCLGHRETSLRKMNEQQEKHFVPVCSDEGYLPLQCHKFSGHCWCSDIKGLPIPETVRMKDTPTCPSHTGTSSHHPSASSGSVSSRRKGSTDVSLNISSSKDSPNHPSDPAAKFFPSPTTNTSEIESVWWKVNYEGNEKERESKSDKRRRKSKAIHGCSAKQRRIFNKSMLDQLKTEYLRTDPSLPPSESELDSLNWKFLQLDHRKDGYLRPNEYGKMAKLVRQVIKPKRCAKKFPKMCDINKDKKISRKEWIDCLTSVPTSKTARIKNVKTGRKNSKKKKKKKTKLGRGRKSKLRPCDYEQKQINETIQSGDHNVYSPKCSKSGTYNQIQCYGTVLERYCFCVDVYTGVMIENTYIMNGKPNKCPVSWPKCPSPLKSSKFLHQLLQFFGEFVQSKTSRLHSQSREHEVVERIFELFDADHNGYLQKAEKRRMKNLLKKGKGLWRCGRKIHKICDLNSDTRISLDELKYCVDTKIGASKMNSVVNSDTRLKGTNPFIETLKSERETHD